MAKLKSKLLSLFLLVCMFVPCMFILTSCGHTHAFSVTNYLIQNDKAYVVKTCDCKEEEKTEIKGAVIANATNVVDKITSAEAGSTIVLSEGNYSLITLYGVDAFKDNIKLVGVKGAVVDGILITSGLTKSEYATESSVMADNLSISNINFIDDIQLRNCTISGLSIKNCKFTGEARIQLNANSFVATYLTHINAKDGDMVKFGYDDIAVGGAANVIKNVTIENNTFDGVHDSLLAETTVLYLSCVDGAIVRNNIINDAEFNGIQITAGSARFTTGKLLVEGNIIKKSGSRSLRFSYFEDEAELIVKNNKLSNANKLEFNAEVVKSSDTGKAKINYQGNTYNGKAISIGKNITKA